MGWRAEAKGGGQSLPPTVLEGPCPGAALASTGAADGQGAQRPGVTRPLGGWYLAQGRWSWAAPPCLGTELLPQSAMASAGLEGTEVLYRVPWALLSTSGAGWRA